MRCSQADYIGASKPGGATRQSCKQSRIQGSSRLLHNPLRVTLIARRHPYKVPILNGIHLPTLSDHGVQPLTNVVDVIPQRLRPQLDSLIWRAYRKAELKLYNNALLAAGVVCLGFNPPCLDRFSVGLRSASPDQEPCDGYHAGGDSGKKYGYASPQSEDAAGV